MFKEKIMVDNLKLFNSNEFGRMRTCCNPNTGDVWFNLNDICKALEIANPWNVKARLEDDLCQTEAILDSLGRTQKMTFVNEAGMYEVVIRSDSPKAKSFRKWICSEVLPSIRKHGAYITEDVLKDDKKLNETIQAIREQYKEKIDFADAFLASEDSAYIAVFADYLTKNGVKMGRNQLFKWFKDKKVLVMHGDDYFPSARYMKMGLFDLEASAISKGNGKKKISHTVKITPKGMKYFMEKIQANKANKTQKQIIDFIQLTLFN